MSNAVKPRGDRITVRKVKATPVSKNGIILPEGTVEDNPVVEVVSVGDGPDVKDIKPGQLVVICQLFERDQIGDLYIVDEEDIRAIYGE